MTIFEQLSAPFPPDRVSWRVGPTNRDKTKGMAFPYIDARDVMERLDSAVGPENWQCDYPHANGKTVCRIGIFVIGHPNDWVWKADGAGDTDMEASKGALSDAFKRAAVRWGVGRYLYDLPTPWVEIEQHGKSYSIKDSELPKLRRVLAPGNGSPAVAAPTARSPSAGAANPSPEIARTLIAALSEAKTKDDLADWYHLDSTQVAKSKLTPKDYQAVAEAYREKMRALVGAEKAETLGAG